MKLPAIRPATRKPDAAAERMSSPHVPGAARRRLLRGIGAAGVSGSGLVAMNPVQAAPVVEQRVTLDGWSKLSVQLPAEVTVNIGAPAPARIRAEAAVIAKVRFTVRQGTLEIAPSGNFSTREGIDIQLVTDRLESVAAGTSATVNVGKLKANALRMTAEDATTVNATSLELARLQVDASGSATVNAGGRAAEQQVSLQDSATYAAGKLGSTSVQIKAAGSSEGQIGTSTKLDAAVSDAATVRYRGKPQLRKNVADAGTLEAD